MNQKLVAMSTGQQESFDQCVKQDMISICMFKRKPNYSAHCTQSGVSILNSAFDNNMLKLKLIHLITIPICYLNHIIKAIILSSIAQLK